ncbi:MAG: molybdopterin-dependent oxidoreductase, partial [Terriglobia bacterium]
FGDGRDFSGGRLGEKGRERDFVNTTCLQCGVTDGLRAYVEEGRIVKVEGNPKNPNTHGPYHTPICAKGQAGAQQVYDPFRIKTPLKRTNKRGEKGEWRQITWEEAVDEVAERLNKIRNSGDPGRFCFHQGRNRFGQFTTRFTNVFGTKHYFNHTSTCESSLKVGYETSFGQDLDASDAARSKYIIEWGDNIYEASYMHNPLMQRLIAGRVDNGAKMVAVDSRLSNTAGAADEWVPVKVGTDAAMILAMCQVIMEKNLGDIDFINTWTNYPADLLKEYLRPFTPAWAESICEVPARTIERLAVEFAKNQPGYARAYNGISNHWNGTYNARCIALLNAIVGNLDKEGGFCLMKFTGFGKVEPEPDIDALLAENFPEATFPVNEDHEEDYPLAHHRTDHLLPHRLQKLDYQMKLYMLHQYNPCFVNPDRKLWIDTLSQDRYAEFIVDFTPYLSETASLVVDLIIPDVSYLERMQINDMPPVENFPFVHLFQPVVEPLYDGSKSMYDTMLAIAKKVDGISQYFDFETVEDYCRESVENGWGPGSWDRLRQDGVLIGDAYDPATYKAWDDMDADERAAMRQFETFKNVIPAAKLTELRADGFTVPSTAGPITDGDSTKGVVMGGVAYQGFPTSSGLFEIHSSVLDEHGFEPLPVYRPNPGLMSVANDEFALTTGKWNVHTQSRTANCAWLLEIMHYNPVWINSERAEDLGIKDGDKVVLENDGGALTPVCIVGDARSDPPRCGLSLNLARPLGVRGYGQCRQGRGCRGLEPESGPGSLVEDQELSRGCDGQGSRGR